MKKRLVLTTVFVAIFGCFVSMADVHDRDYKGNSKGHKTEKVDKKKDNKHDSKKDKVSNKHKPNKPVAHKPAPKPNHKPVAHKPNHKPAPKPVAHKPHKPAPKPVAHRPHRPAPKPVPVCHLNHHHNDHCHKDVVVVKPLNPVAVGAVTTAVTTAAVVGLVAALVN